MGEGGWLQGKGAIGSYIRAQRELSRMSLRELARVSHVSNAYLSQIERGLHEPSVRVLTAVAEALSLPLEDLVAEARRDRGGKSVRSPAADTVAAAIRAEPRLSTAQKEALLAVYESYLAQADSATPSSEAAPQQPADRTQEPADGTQEPAAGRRGGRAASGKAASKRI